METWSLLRNAAMGLALPPGLNVVLTLIALGLIAWPKGRTTRRIGLAFLLISTVVLYGASAPIAANQIIGAVHSRAPAALTPSRLKELASSKPDAVVLLTGGITMHAPEFDSAFRPTDATWVRTLYAEDLALRIGAPLLISGKGPFHDRDEAQAIAQFVWRLAKSRVLIENVSTNTREAAVAIRLKHPNVRNVILVSDAVHLLRAVPVFERAGYSVVAAPTRYADMQITGGISLIPSGEKLVETRAALHAWIGHLLGL